MTVVVVVPVLFLEEDETLYDAGWWSVGFWATLLVAFATAYVAAVYFGHLWSGAIWLVLTLGSPFLAWLYGWLLFRFADPNPGCTNECIGRIWLLLLAGAALFGWWVGLLAGAVHRRLQSRL